MTMVGLGDMSSFGRRLAGCEQLPTGLQGRMLQALNNGEDAAVEFFNKHIEEVKLVVPSERLLIFDVRQGWEPLCKFLDVPVPDQPFPKINDANELKLIFNSTRVVAWVTILAVPVLVGLGMYYLPTIYLPVLIIFIFGLFWGAGWTVSKLTNDYSKKAKKDNNRNLLDRKGQ